MNITYITTLEDQKEIDVLNDAIRSNHTNTILNAQKMLNEYSYFYVLVYDKDNVIGSIYDIVRLVSEGNAKLVHKDNNDPFGYIGSIKLAIDNRMKPRLTIKEI